VKQTAPTPKDELHPGLVPDCALPEISLLTNFIDSLVVRPSGAVICDISDGKAL
jgi:hypothetical protein